LTLICTVWPLLLKIRTPTKSLQRRGRSISPMAPLFSKVVAPLAVFAGLFVTSEAIKVEKPSHLRGGSISSIPMHTYRSDCGKKSHLSLINVPVPGTGMDPSAIKPFNAVLKDGFYEIDCVKDYLFEHGDKFGDNKFKYKLEQVSNVSIVHYSSHVAKMDREDMTHETCFLFCRTIPDMMFFGMTNGRECYCAPYYKAEADDSSQCDAPCDGNPGAMCGGKSKSTIFGMHHCSNTVATLKAAADSMVDLQGKMGEQMMDVKTAMESMQSEAAAMQVKFGNAGDPGASDLLQSAKVFAGELEAAHGVASQVDVKMSELKTSADGVAKAKSAEEVGKAEDLTKEIAATTLKAEDSIEEMEGLMESITKAAAAAQDAEGAAKQYLSLMYFVDQEKKDLPSTCTGTAAEKPIVATIDGCARACDGDIHECVGFSFFPLEGRQQVPEGLCFLMSKFKTATYYTGCNGQHEFNKCYAKLSKFESTSIAPKADGTCENCLKEVTKADRCFGAAGQLQQQGGQ